MIVHIIIVYVMHLDCRSKTRSSNNITSGLTKRVYLPCNSFREIYVFVLTSSHITSTSFHFVYIYIYIYTVPSSKVFDFVGSLFV